MKIEIKDELINECLKNLNDYSKLIKENNDFLIECYQKASAEDFDKKMIEKLDGLCQDTESWDSQFKTLTKAKELILEAPNEFVQLIELIITVTTDLKTLQEYHDKIVDIGL